MVKDKKPILILWIEINDCNSDEIWIFKLSELKKKLKIFF